MLNTGNQRIEDYLSVLSSKEPIPGGGGASAIAAGLGGALGAMVCNLTKGKKKYAAYEEDILRILAILEEKSKKFIDFADEDAEVFYPLAKAYSEKVSDEEMEELLYRAASTPLSLMREIYAIMDYMDFLANYGSGLAISDVGVGVSLLRAGLSGAIMNVLINTKMIKNVEKKQVLETEAKSILQDGIIKADRIYGKVLERL